MECVSFSNGSTEVKEEDLSLDQIVSELSNDLILFLNALNLNDKRIAKLEEHYNDIEQRILEKEVAY